MKELGQSKVLLGELNRELGLLRAQLLASRLFILTKSEHALPSASFDAARLRNCMKTLNI